MDAGVPNVIALAGLISGLGLAAFWDLRTMRIPRVIPAMLAVLWALSEGVAGLYAGDELAVWAAGCLESLAAAVLMAGLLLLVRTLMGRRSVGRSLGLGDVKLMAVVALYLGWDRALCVLLLACCFALLLAVLLPRVGWKTVSAAQAPIAARHAAPVLTVIPFAPAILLATLLVVPL